MKRYQVFYQKNKIKESIIISSNDISSELLPLNVLSIKELNKEKKHFISLFLLLQLVSKLNRVLQVNITLIKALKILKESEKNTLLLLLLEDLLFCLKKGNTMDLALEKYEFNNKAVVLHYFKMASSKGNAKLIIKELYKLLKNISKINASFIMALRYPMILLFALFFCFFSIFIFVIPNMELVFENQKDLPFMTQRLLGLYYFLKDFYLLLFLGLFVLFFIIVYLKKKIKYLSYLGDKILFLFMPIVKELIYKKNMYVFFKSIATLLKLKYELNTAIDSSLALINNYYLLDRMSTINEDLQKGLSIEEAFENTNVFDETTLSLLKIGQESSTIDFIINDIVKIYKKDFNKLIKNIAVLIEPIFFFFISILIVWIVLAVFQPIWGISDIIN